VQGSALARLFRLPDTEADFAATVQQFGMAAIVELLIAFALIAWEMLRPAAVTAPRPTKEVEDRPIELAEARPSFKAAPKPKLVSSQTPAGRVSDYVLARLEATKGCEIEFGEAYVDYTVWCKARNFDPLLPELFAKAMKRLCAKAQVSIKRKDGSAVLVEVRLAASALDRYDLSSMDIVRLRRDHIDLERGRLLIRRMSRTVERQISANDLHEIKLYLASRNDLGPWMFVSRTGKPLSRDALVYIVERAGEEAGLTGLHPRHLATT
jgi:integrase